MVTGVDYDPSLGICPRTDECISLFSVFCLCLCLCLCLSSSLSVSILLPLPFIVPLHPPSLQLVRTLMVPASNQTEAGIVTFTASAGECTNRHSPSQQAIRPPDASPSRSATTEVGLIGKKQPDCRDPTSLRRRRTLLCTYLLPSPAEDPGGACPFKRFRLSWALAHRVAGQCGHQSNIPGSFPDVSSMRSFFSLAL